MDILIVAGLGIGGAWLIAKLFSIGERARLRHSGCYVSADYRRRTQRQCRSEFVANIELRR